MTGVISGPTSRDFCFTIEGDSDSRGILSRCMLSRWLLRRCFLEMLADTAGSGGVIVSPLSKWVPSIRFKAKFSLDGDCSAGVLGYGLEQAIPPLDVFLIMLNFCSPTRTGVKIWSPFLLSTLSIVSGRTFYLKHGLF